MADELRLEIEGIEPLLETFRKYFTDINGSPIIEYALKEIAQNIASRAQGILQEKIYNTPESPNYKRTGLLQTNTVADKSIVRDSRNNPEIFIRSKQDYAAYVELGTSKMKARPFLLPAGQMEVDASEKIFEEALREFLNSKITI